MLEPAHQAADAGARVAEARFEGSAAAADAGTGITGAGDTGTSGTGAAHAGSEPAGSGYAGTADALAAVRSALAFLAAADAGSLPVGELADCLLALERAESVHTAARARILAAFNARGGFELDGSRSAKSWLISHTQVTGGAAAGAMGWMRRLAAHPRAGESLAAQEISSSVARQVCDWSNLLPPDVRDDADEILLAAAAGGAGLAFRLDVLYGGHGRPAGDLSPECTAALQAALASLGKKAGPEDTRTKGQRDHDALEELCRRWLPTCIVL